VTVTVAALVPVLAVMAVGVALIADREAETPLAVTANAALVADARAPDMACSV
jgi:hypothetical protein